MHPKDDRYGGELAVSLPARLSNRLSLDGTPASAVLHPSFSRDV